MPTLVAAAGDPDIVDKLKKGYDAGGKNFKIHPDGYNFLPFFNGTMSESPRKEIIYFGAAGDLNAVRYENWKINFATIQGNIASGVREVTGWPIIVNLRADPYEKMPHEAELGYFRWYADNMWLFVPVQQVIKEFLQTIPDYPFQEGSNLNAAGINYNSLRAADALKRIDQMQGLTRPGN
jgi:arylsulfatase